MSVSRRVIHHGLYFAVLGPLIGVLFLVLYIFFAKEPLVLLVIIQVLPLFLLLSITTGAIPALLTGVGSDSNLLIVFYVQIMPDDLVMQLHRF